MKVFTSIILIIASMNIFATPLTLECRIEFDSLENEDESTMVVRMNSFKKDGTLMFEKSVDNLQTYFFPDFGPAVWHSDAKLKIEAQLNESKLTYKYRFYNHMRNRNSLSLVFDETREIFISMDDVDRDGFDSFDQEDGLLISEKVINESWINKRAYKLESCRLYNKYN